MITSIDDVIGNTIDTLKNSSLWHNTLLVFTSDHGGDISYGASNYPLRGSKHTLYEGGVRVPTIVSGGVVDLEAMGNVNEGLFHVSDWFPTIANISGANIGKMERTLSDFQLKSLNILGAVDIYHHFHL